MRKYGVKVMDMIECKKLETDKIAGKERKLGASWGLQVNSEYY
jgi:hypothetical protein